MGGQGEGTRTGIIDEGKGKKRTARPGEEQRRIGKRRKERKGRGCYINERKELLHAGERMRRRKKCRREQGKK